MMRRLGTRSTGLALGLALCVQAGVLWAEPLPAVALITDRREHPVVQRLRAELTAVEVTTAVIVRRVPPAAVEVSSIVGRAHGAAALSVFVATGRLDLWLIDLDGPKIASSAPIPDEPGAAGLLVLRTVELLRARLIALPRAERPAITTKREGRAPPPPPPRRRRSWPVLAVELGAGPTLDPGGLSPMAHLWLRLGWNVWSRVGFDLIGAVPLHGGEVRESEVTADAKAGLVALGVRLLLAAPEARWLPSVGAGLGVCFVRIGFSEMVWLSKRESHNWVTSGLGYLRTGLSLRLGWHLRVRVDGLVGLLSHQPVVEVSGRQSAAWGRPLIGLTAGLELQL